MNNKYKITISACFIGYIVQAIVNNFVPLLFLTFHSQFEISLSKITLLVTVNFGVQLIIDLLSSGFIDKIGYKASIVIAHIFASAGLVMLAILPDVYNNSYVGLMISVIIYAIGGGLIEVLVSPIMEACPTDHKEKAMSLLHSFYCWGYVGVILLSTVFFRIFGIENWRVLSLIWAVIPFANIFIFIKAPVLHILEEGEKGLSIKTLFSKKIFWILMLMMMCAGASEQAVSQWASTFAEFGLKVSKTVGDLAGPMAFAILMGISRTIYGKYGDRLDLDKFMKYSTVLCVISYLVISLVSSPVIALAGCAMCGLSVGIMWPGTFSKAAAALKSGGTLMFALLALAGDVGCSAGPTLAGMVSSVTSDNLKTGILAAIIFPILMFIGILGIGKKIKSTDRMRNIYEENKSKQ